MTRPSEDNKKHKKSDTRGERLAAALRENLRRRKAQERGRSTPESLAKSPPTAADKQER